MNGEVIVEKVEALAVWEAPAMIEYDAKAEIQGAGLGRNEVGFLNS